MQFDDEIVDLAVPVDVEALEDAVKTCMETRRIIDLFERHKVQNRSRKLNKTDIDAIHNGKTYADFMLEVATFEGTNDMTQMRPIAKGNLSRLLKGRDSRSVTPKQTSTRPCVMPSNTEKLAPDNKQQQCPFCKSTRFRVIDPGRSDGRRILECARLSCLASLDFTDLPEGTMIGETLQKGGNGWYLRDPRCSFYPNESSQADYPFGLDESKCIGTAIVYQCKSRCSKGLQSKKERDSANVAAADRLEFQLAGLYTIHSGQNCAHLQADHVILSEAAQYAVDYANSYILNDLNLHINHLMADTCDDRSTTLQETVYMTRNGLGFCKGNLTRDELSNTLLAAVGSFNCDLAENINYLLQAFCIPVISSLCTASQLDNKESFPFFARTASDDMYRAQVMYDVLMSQEWYHIAVITDVSTTGQSLWSQFYNMLYYCTMPVVTNLLFRSPCIERTFEIDCNNSQKFLFHTNELKSFLAKRQVSVYMLFAEDSCINKILLYIQGAGYIRGDLQFVLPSMALNNSLDILEYAYAVDTYGEPVDSFIEQLKATTIQETENQFLIELIMIDNVCCWSSDFYEQTDCPFSVACTGNETIRNLPTFGMSQARKVMDSVMWLARAVHGLYSEFCIGSIGYCKTFVGNFTGEAFFAKMLNTNFTSFNSSEIFQVLNGSGLPVYNVWQRQDATWVTVLKRYNPLFGPDPSDENMEPIDIPIFDRIHTEAADCQRTCDKQVLNFQGQSCCWTCQSCAEYFYINQTLMECIPCPENQIPDENLAKCVSVEKSELFLEPTSEMNVIIVLNAIGILLTLPAIVLLFYRRKTPMVRAATPDLAYQQIGFISLLFITSALMIPSTSGIVCGCVWGFSALLLTATHSVSLSKALRISRAEFFVRFISRGAKSPQKASIFLHLIMIFIQLFIVILWILLRPPRIVWERRTQFPKCTSNNESQTIVLLLNPAVLLLITLYFQKQAMGNQYMYQVKQARIGLAGTLCFLVNYLVLMALILIDQSTEQVRTIVLMCIPMITGYIAWVTNLLPTTWEVLTKSKKNHQEYVTRQRSRQFQQGNIMYYVESVIFNRPKGHTIATIDSAVNSVIEK
ncbi:unnamed protein product, partial [Mesorhabditis belari]|uniref:G-protein coupled receptors family 3 profile domain-containing protein n=1 Tax=Mesorhabditis belari TaxID=2138241 RepID=A0AAF3F1J3_9BILA